MEPDIELPRDVNIRMLNTFTEDIDIRVRELTTLVALQETELVVLWITIFSLVGFVLWKEYHNG